MEELGAGLSVIGMVTISPSLDVAVSVVGTNPYDDIEGSNVPDMYVFICDTFRLFCLSLTCKCTCVIYRYIHVATGMCIM